MTILSPFSLTRGNRFCRFFSAGLCLALAGTTSGMSVHIRDGSKSGRICPTERPGIEPGYLLVLGPSAFRFAPLAPVATERPVVPPAAVVVFPKETSEEKAPVATTPVAEATPSTKDSTNSESKPLRILPDDTPSEIHPEDILPYFKLPRNGENGSVSLPFTPAAPTLPASSASYELK